MSVIISRRAKNDLFEIWEYIANDSFAQADKMSDEFEGIFSLLAENPEMGRSREELKENLRGFPHGNYVIFYQGDAGGIQIIRVLHGARDIPEKFED